MRMITFAKRTLQEILRDPLTLIFGLGFPAALILLLSLAACDAQYSSQSSTKKKKKDKDAVISDTSDRVSEPEASETQPETEGIKGKRLLCPMQFFQSPEAVYKAPHISHS